MQLDIGFDLSNVHSFQYPYTSEVQRSEEIWKDYFNKFQYPYTSEVQPEKQISYANNVSFNTHIRVRCNIAAAGTICGIMFQYPYTSEVQP